MKKKRFESLEGFKDFINDYEKVNEQNGVTMYNNPEKRVEVIIFNSDIVSNLTEIERNTIALGGIQSGLAEPFIYPKELIYVQGEFIGYTRNYIKDAISVKDISDYICDKSDNLEYLLGTAVKIANAVKKVHSKGIVLGNFTDEQILVSDKNVYIIINHTCGFINKANCKPILTFTEEYVDPEVVDFSTNTVTQYSKNTDNYSLAIIIFKMLTGVHPFSGQYEFCREMETVIRAKNGLSIIGNYKIFMQNPRTWENWMMEDLMKAFLDIFEYKQRYNIFKNLQKQYEALNQVKMWEDNVLSCWNKHSYQYELKGLLRIFSNDELLAIYSNNTYVKANGAFIHTDVNGNIIKSEIPQYSEGEVYFLANTEFKVSIYPYYSGFFSRVFKSNNGYVMSVYKNDNCLKSYFLDDKKSVEIYGNNIFYISDDNVLKRITIIDDKIEINDIVAVNGCLKYMGTAEDDYAVVFEHEDGLRIKFSQESVVTSGSAFVILKYDNITKTWLFISKSQGNGDKIVYNTIIFKEGKEVFETNEINYYSNDLNGVEYFDGKLYMPNIDKIVVITLYSETNSFIQIEEISIEGVSKKSVLECVCADGEFYLYIYEDLNVYRLML